MHARRSVTIRCLRYSAHYLQMPKLDVQRATREETIYYFSPVTVNRILQTKYANFELYTITV